MAKKRKKIGSDDTGEVSINAPLLDESVYGQSALGSSDSASSTGAKPDERQPLLTENASEQPITKLKTKVTLAHLFIIGPSITTFCTLCGIVCGFIPYTWPAFVISAAVGLSISLLISPVFLGIEIGIAKSLAEYDQKTARILFKPTTLIGKAATKTTKLINKLFSRLRRVKAPQAAQSLAYTALPEITPPAPPVLAQLDPIAQLTKLLSATRTKQPTEKTLQGIGICLFSLYMNDQIDSSTTSGTRDPDEEIMEEDAILDKHEHQGLAALENLFEAKPTKIAACLMAIPNIQDPQAKNAIAKTINNYVCKNNLCGQVVTTTVKRSKTLTESHKQQITEQTKQLLDAAAEDLATKRQSDPTSYNNDIKKLAENIYKNNPETLQLISYLGTALDMRMLKDAKPTQGRFRTLGSQDLLQHLLQRKGFLPSANKYFPIAQLITSPETEIDTFTILQQLFELAGQQDGVRADGDRLRNYLTYVFRAINNNTFMAPLLGFPNINTNDLMEDKTKKASVTAFVGKIGTIGNELPTNIIIGFIKAGKYTYITDILKAYIAARPGMNTRGNQERLNKIIKELRNQLTVEQFDRFCNELDVKSLAKIFGTGSIQIIFANDQNAAIFNRTDIARVTKIIHANNQSGETTFLNSAIKNEILPLLEILNYIRIINLGNKAHEINDGYGNDIMCIFGLAGSDVIEPDAKTNYIAAIDALLRKELPNTYAKTIQTIKNLLSPLETTGPDKSNDEPTHSDIPRICITNVIVEQIDNDKEKKELFRLAKAKEYNQLQKKLLDLAVKVFNSDHFFNRPGLYRLINAKNKDGDTIAHIVAQDELSDATLLTLAQLKSTGANFETTNAKNESVNGLLSAKDGLHIKLDTLHNEIDELEIVLQRCPNAMTEKADCADKLSRMRLINDALPNDEQNERYKKLQQLRELLHNHQLNPNDIEKTTTKIKAFLPNINRQRILALILQIVGTSDNNQLFLQLLNDFADSKNKLFTIDASAGTLLQIATATNNKAATLAILEELNSWHNLPNIFELGDAPDTPIETLDNNTRCAYINYCTKDRPPASYLAAEFGDMETIKVLLENNATQDLVAYSHYLALAIRSGDVVKLLYLLDEAKETKFLGRLKNNDLLSSEIKQIPDPLTRNYIIKVLAVYGIVSDAKQSKSAIHIEHKENAPTALIANGINCTELIMEAIEEAKVHLSITKRIHKNETQKEIDNFTTALTRTLPQLVLEQQDYTKKSHGGKFTAMLTIATRKVVMQYIARTERHKQPKTHKTNSDFQFTEYKIAQIKAFQAEGFKSQIIEQINQDKLESLPTVAQFLRKFEGIDAMLKSEITRLKLATWEKEKPEESIYAMFMSFARIIDTLNNFKTSFNDIKNTTLRRFDGDPSNEKLENILAAKRVMIREQLPFTEEQLRRINKQIATSLADLGDDPQNKDKRNLAQKRLAIIATELDHAADEETANEIQRELFNIEEEEPESEISAAEDETPNLISDTTPLIASPTLDGAPEQTNPTHSSIATFFKTTAVNQADNARITASLFWNTLLYMLPVIHKQPTDTQINPVEVEGPQS